MTRHLKDPFYIGDWLVQPMQNRIRKDERVVRLEPKVMDVLLCLSARPGQVVTRDRLHDEVWSGTVVSDDVLSRSVSELRKAFNDDSRNPGVIETIPKSGYRLLLPPVDTFRGDNLPIEPPVLEMAAHAPPVARVPGRQHLLLLAVLAIAGMALIIYLVLPDNTAPPPAFHPSPITSYPGTEGDPKLSPDGRQVAFHWRGTGGDNLDIYVKMVNSESVLRLTDNEGRDHSPAWSPDGSRIAYMSRGGSGCEINVVPSLGGTPRRLGSCGANIYGDLAWTPDGEWLAFNDRENPSDAFSIYLLSLKDGERRRLTSPPSDTWGDHDPAFAKDGSRLTFTRSVSEGMQDIYVASAGGGDIRRLTADSRNIGGHAWTADGGGIVFSSNRTGRFSLWRVSPDGGDDPVWLGLSDAESFFPNLAGDRLAYRSASAETDIWKAATVSSTGTPLITSTRWDMHPRVSPDGNRIAFTSNRSGTYEIWIADSDGANPVRLTEFSGPFTSTPRWSPDSEQLAFTARRGGQADIYIMDVTETRPRRFTTAPESDELAASWSRDGTAIYFSSNRNGSWHVWKQPVAGGTPQRVTSDGGFGPLENSDGTAIYYTKHNVPGLWRTIFSDNSEEQVLIDFDPRDWGSWDIVGDDLYYLDRGQPTVVARLNLPGSRTDTVFVAELPVPSMDPALAIAPSGDWILIGQVDRQESDLMLVDGFE